MISIGLMSGTSMDGIDAAMIDTDGDKRLIEVAKGDFSLSYEPEFKILLKAAEYCVRKHEGELELAEQSFVASLAGYLSLKLNFEPKNIGPKVDELANYLRQRKFELTLSGIIKQSTLLHAQVIHALLRKMKLTADQIDVVGYHGQTLYHNPAKRMTHQVGDGKWLADLVGITVVNDFRRKDLKNGGEGAPFAPLFHRALALRDKLPLPLAVVNCGGIANITVINSEEEFDVLGFDTGPGNCLVDQFIRHKTNGIEQMDTNGQFGKLGVVNHAVLKLLYFYSAQKNNHNYFDLKPPKSLDYNDLKLIPELDDLSFEDAVRTLEAFTADSIVRSLHWLPITPTMWILAGGGWHNPVIFYELKTRLQQKLGQEIQVLRADEIKWNNQSLEAQIFAYFAVRSLLNLPLTVPGTTGVSNPMSGGRVHISSQGITAAVEKLLDLNSTFLQAIH